MTFKLLVSFLGVGAFVACFHWLGVTTLGRSLAQTAYEGVSTVTDSGVSDAEKEVKVRNSGKALLLGSASMAWRLAVCLLVTATPIYIADVLGLVLAGDVFDIMLRLEYLAFLMLLTISASWVLNRFHDSGSALEETTYQSGARLFHTLAFASPVMQKLAAQVDDAAFHITHRSARARPPIFITSLARGGTTPLLNALSGLQDVATHTYRDMPFITAPFLWNMLSRPFRKPVQLRERAHGDGIEIDLESPEAFEEVYWQLYWQKNYGEKIELWGTDDFDANALSRLQNCFLKVPIIRGRPEARYLAKNNAHIARLRFIRDAFSGAQIIVPLRRPAPHAASLLRQHQNFLEKHAQDYFGQRYMRDIGHFEFGNLHKLIGFNGLTSENKCSESPDYWLSYWLAAFLEVQSQQEACLFITQEDLRNHPNTYMRALLHRLGLDAHDTDFAPYFRSEPDQTDRMVFSPDLLEIADALYEELTLLAVHHEASQFAQYH